VSTNAAAGTAAVLDDRALSTCSDRAVLGGDATGVDWAAAAERRTVLAEDLAVGPAAGSPGYGAAGTTRRGGAGAAEPAGRGATAAGVVPQTCPTSNGRSRSLGRRVAAKGAAVAAQNGTAALATDA
jgi:hypothetical protein